MDSPALYRIKNGSKKASQLRKELLAQMGERRGPCHYGEELHESAEEKAQKLVKGALQADLARHPKGDQKKVQIALQIREQTVMTMG